MADDPLSPTTLVMNYLRSKGLPPNAQNIRAALTENARDPSLIPGLRNDAPPSDTGSTAPSRSGGGAGKPQNVAKNIEGSSALPTPPIPPATAPGAPKTTSAAPTNNPPINGGLNWDDILGLGIAGGAGALGLRSGAGASAGAGASNPGAQFMGNAGSPPFASAAPPDAIAAPPAAPMIASDPMQAAMAKAVGDGSIPASPMPSPQPQMPQLPAPPQQPMLGNGGGSGSVVPSQSIPMPDATSGPVITPQNTGTGPTLVTPRTEPPRAAPVNTPGLMEDFLRFVRGIGARR